MDFLFINRQELSALMGLPYIQQSAYLLGIRPYMDRNTFIVGIKRGISYQSLAEALYVEPHQGIQSTGSPSRQQLRRIIKSIERAGLVDVQSSDKKLILKCLLANEDYSDQNKPDTNPTQQANTKQVFKNQAKSSRYDDKSEIPDTGKKAKADTPHNSRNNCVLLGEHFDKFWKCYPQPHDETHAWEEFKRLNPSEYLFSEIMKGLKAQIKNREELQLAGEWVPHWKFPANWLAHQSWKLPLQTVRAKEQPNENNARYPRKKSAVDILTESCKDATFDFDE